MKELFIAGIGPMTGYELRTLLNYYGSVRSAGISVNRQTGEPRGLGFAMADQQDATAVIAALNGAEYDGRKLFVACKKNMK
jgi:RNA recognition motif-containing protein